MQVVIKQEVVWPSKAPSDYQRETNSKEFCWNGDVFSEPGRFSINFSNGLSGFSSELRVRFKDLLIEFIDLNQLAKSTYSEIPRFLNGALKHSKPCVLDVKWLLSIKLKQFRSVARRVSVLFDFMFKRCPELFDEEIFQALYDLRPKKNNGCNVLSDDPEISRLTNSEFDSIVWRIWDNFDKGLSSTQVTLVKLLDCQYFRRPIQFAQLKIGDVHLDWEDDVSKIHAPRIFFPGAKDRFSKTSFRNSKSEYRPLPEHFIDLIRLQVEDIRDSFNKIFECSLTENELNTLPLFSSHAQIKKASVTLKNHYKLDPVENFNHELFHLSPQILGRIIKWESNAPINASWGPRVVETPISERTGRNIVVTATRMRHTGIFKLARRGVSRAILSYMMGHTSPGSLDAYYKDPAEEARVLDEAMKDSLTQIHMAFTGKLLGKDEKLKVIKESPDSILEHHANSQLSPVGNCGKHSFCSTQTIPVPCYRCNSFQPFVDANHQQVLDALLLRQDQENQTIQLGSAKHLLRPIDLSSDISCVLNVIAQCRAYKESEGVK